jgi:hypothetical protein
MTVGGIERAFGHAKRLKGRGNHPYSAPWPLQLGDPAQNPRDKCTINILNVFSR